MDKTKSKLKCVRCNSAMVKRTGTHGVFYGCSTFPECDYSFPVAEAGMDAAKIIKHRYDLDVDGKMAELLLSNYGDGVVYLVRINKNGLLKIGRSINFLSRIYSLDSEHGGVTPVLLLRTKFYATLEIFLHELYQDYLIERLEYFDLPAEYLVEISKLEVFMNNPVEHLTEEKIALGEALAKRAHETRGL